MKKNICECCGQEVIDELEIRTMWDGEDCMCCEECRKTVDNDKSNSSIDLPDEYDRYIDNLSENDYI